MSELESDLRKPNPEFLKEEFRPLLERDPVVIWRYVSLLLFIANIVLIYVLMQE